MAAMRKGHATCKVDGCPRSDNGHRSSLCPKHRVSEAWTDREIAIALRYAGGLGHEFVGVSANPRSGVPEVKIECNSAAQAWADERTVSVYRKTAAGWKRCGGAA